MSTSGRECAPHPGQLTSPFWVAPRVRGSGTRHQPGARVAGAGAYVLHAAEHYPKDSQNASAVYHTYLIYELAVPHELGPVQDALHVRSEGGFTLQVKSPEAPSTNPAVRNKPESKHAKVELFSLSSRERETECLSL